MPYMDSTSGVRNGFLPDFVRLGTVNNSTGGACRGEGKECSSARRAVQVGVGAPSRSSRKTDTACIQRVHVASSSCQRQTAGEEGEEGEERKERKERKEVIPT